MSQPSANRLFACLRSRAITRAAIDCSSCDHTLPFGKKYEPWARPGLTDRVFYRFAWAEARHTARRRRAVSNVRAVAVPHRYRRGNESLSSVSVIGKGCDYVTHANTSGLF